MIGRSDRKIGIIEVAQIAGVSPGTVSNVVNNRRYVDAHTRLKVLEAIRVSGYRPNKAAQNLRLGRTGRIAIFSSMPFSIAGGPARMGFMMEVAGSVAARALEKGLGLILVPPILLGENPIGRIQTDGVIVIDPLIDDPTILSLTEEGIPVVSLGLESAHSRIPHVEFHSWKGASLLLEHLFERSARSIAFLAGSEARHNSNEGVRAYREFAHMHSMVPHVLRVPETGGEVAAFQATQDLLRAHPEIDGMVAYIDVFASGALAAAQALGRSVPDDFRLATRYDGLITRTCRPSLTALDLHLPTLGEIAFDMLISLCNGEDIDNRETPVPTVAIRSST